MPAKQLKVYCVPANRKTKGLIALVGSERHTVIKKAFSKRPLFIIDDLARRVSCASLVGVVERCQHCLRRRM